MANMGENNVEDSDNAPMSGLYENVPTTNINLGAQSEITDFSADGLGATHSVVTDTSTRVTYDSDTPFNRSLRRSRYDLPSSGRSTRRSRSRSSRRTTFSLSTGVINPRGLKSRGRFIWELIKLNYRMLISLTLTLFVAIFVPLPPSLFPFCVRKLTLDLREFIVIPGFDLQTREFGGGVCEMDGLYSRRKHSRRMFLDGT